MSLRLRFGLLAIVLAAVGLAMAAAPGLALEVGALAIALLGFVFLAVGYERYLQAKRTERERTEVSEVEERPPMVTPGDALDATWDEYRFEAIAAAVVADAYGCGREEADRLLATGDWTDNQYAAAYFDETHELHHPTRLWWMPFRGAGSTRTMRQHAVAELASLVGLEVSDDG